MSDKILFNTEISAKSFYHILSKQSIIELKPYEKWLKNIKENIVKEGIYILSEECEKIIFFKPVPQNHQLILILKQNLIESLNIDENNVMLVKDEDDNYKNQGLVASTGIMNPVKIVFNNIILPFSEFFPIFNSNDYSWSLKSSFELKETYKNLGYTQPKLNQDSNISLFWENIDEWFYDNESNVVGVGLDDAIDIKNDNLHFQMDEESEQRRYLCFQFLMENNNIMGFNYEGGSFELVSMIMNALKPEVKFDWSIYWNVKEKDILITPNGDYNSLKYLIKKTGTISY